MSKKRRALQLVHGCGRNLARVSWIKSNPSWTRDELTVSPNPNVDQDDYRPWSAANHAGPLGTARREAATPGRSELKDWDWHDRTYTWRCKCGRTITRRHEQISVLWEQVSHKPYDRAVWRVVLSD
jgi:hypothetical protein